MKFILSVSLKLVFSLLNYLILIRFIHDRRLDPIPARKGGQFYPLKVFLTKFLKKTWSEAVEIFLLLLNLHSPPFRAKTGILY